MFTCSSYFRQHWRNCWLLQAMKWHERETAAFLNLASSPPLLLQVPWDGNPHCLPTPRPHSWSALALGESRWQGLSPKAVQDICVTGAASCAGLDPSPLHNLPTQDCRWGAIHHFKFSIYRFPQCLTFVLWILVMAQCWPKVPANVVKRARDGQGSSFTTFIKIQMTALPKWIWK